jgi:Mrp family chromosome partitioning ATPase
MTTEPTSPAARYLTLRDYVHVLRRYWIMIVALAIIGAGAGLVFASRQKPVYQATAEVNFQDPNHAVGLIGLGSNTAETPAQIASVNAQTVTSPAVMTQVKRRLRTPMSVGSLAGAISAAASQQSGLLAITATGSSPAFATRLANAVAQTLVAQDNRQTRAQFAQLAADIRARIARLPHTPAVEGPNGPLSFYENELARMDTLGAFATSVQLEKLAQPPAAASSPTRTRSALLGLVLGLLLGVVFAFVRDSMDRRLRNPHDVDASYRLPLLGHVGKRSLGRIVYLARGPRDIRAPDLDQFRILRRNVEFLDQENPPRCILVTSAVPQEGKTTVASSLAFAMASAGKRTLLVDCDLRRSDLARRLGVSGSPGISEYLAGTASPEEILRTVEFTETSTDASAAPISSNGHAAVSTPEKLVCIPSGSPSYRATELLGSERFREFLAEVCESYDAVILDSSPLLPVADTLEMAPHVDVIVICARDSRTTREQAMAVRSALSRFPERPTGVVVTGVKPRSAEELYAYAHSYT